MGDEALALPVEIARLMKIVQSGFADGDDLVEFRQFTQPANLRFDDVLVIGMHACGTVNLIARLDAPVHAVEGFEGNADAYHAPYSVGLDARHQLIEIVVEIGQIDSIEVAMRVEKQFRIQAYLALG